MTECKISDRTKFFIGVGLVAFFCIPILRSGGRTGLTGFQWLVNHTVFGKPVEYVPEEDYRREIEGVKITRAGSYQSVELLSR